MLIEKKKKKIFFFFLVISLTRSSSRIISAIPGLISKSSLFDKLANVIGSMDVCGKIGVFIPDDGDTLLRGVFVAIDVDCVFEL